MRIRTAARPREMKERAVSETATVRAADAPQNEPQNEDEKDILRVYRSLSRRTKHEFMAMVYEFENREELEGDKESSAHSEDNPHRIAQA